MGEYVEAARLEQIPETEGLVVDLRGQQIGLFRVDGQIHAINNLCPHRGGPLAEGQRDGSRITCPWHAWSFELTSGACTFNESIKVECFPVRIERDKVLVEIP